MERELKRLRLQLPTRPWFQLVLTPSVAAEMALKDRLKTERMLREAQRQLEAQMGIVRPVRRLP